MEVLRMDTISDLSSTQEYSDIDLEGDSREIEAGSPGDMSMVAAVEVRKLASGMSGAAAGHGPSCGSDGEQPPSPHGSSRVTSPSSAASSSMNSPQPQVCVTFVLITVFAAADLHSKILDSRPPPGSKFFQFHAVFGKFWQNRMLAPPLESWRPILGEILDPPLICFNFPRTSVFFVRPLIPLF